MLAEAAAVLALAAGHHPFLSKPAEVRDLIVGLVTAGV